MKKLFLFIFVSVIYGLAFSGESHIPWYTGPLISTSQNNISPGIFAVQPFLSYNVTYGNSIPKTFSFISQLVLQGAITNWLDLTGEATYMYNEKKDQHSQQFGDTTLSLGFQILKERKLTSIPSIRLKIYETFPTGKYKNLNPSKLGIDASGSGSYLTTFDLIIGKNSFWITDHPIIWSFSTSYTIPSNTNVSGFNRYGGGMGTKGKINPGNIFIEDIAIQFSFTQRWVYAMDIIYLHSSKTSFKGIPGMVGLGNLAQNSFPSSELISLAPAIEYNFTAYMGIIGGVFFSVWEKNSSKFVSGMLSVDLAF